MKIFKLAIACFTFNCIEGFNKSYNDLLKNTNQMPDLSNTEHSMEILKWLRKWGCRHLKKEYHIQASGELRNWYKENYSIIPDKNTNIWELNNDDFDIIKSLYKSLSGKKAAIRKLSNGKTTEVTFGPTGASKILFAIRPKVLIPWDNAMRNKLKLKDDDSGYIEFIKYVKKNLEVLKEQCLKNNFSLEELPKKIGRPKSTIPKLIDEFHWVTLTKGCEIPDSKIFKEWLNFKL